VITKQTTNTVILVAPTEFESNPEACADNHFADSAADFEKTAILREASQLKNALAAAGVNVIEIDPSVMAQSPNAPDGCFPNNWLMFVEGKPFLCPMKATSRRRERLMWPEIESRLRGEHLQFENATDLSEWEKEERFLEGTGSLVLDRVNRVAFAALSERTSLIAAKRATKLLGYQLVAFEARDPQGRAVYHTNVVMAIGSEFAVFCPEALEHEAATHVREMLSTHREVIEITWDQVLHYCGNVLELSTANGGIVAMSSTAYDALTADQLSAFKRCGAEPVYADISNIERVAGGSVRCMLAEVF
jgi:hypothetical protein